MEDHEDKTASVDGDDIPTLRSVEAWGAGGIPDRLGPYVLHEIVGWGGMGAVYAALDERNGERVAIKVMRTDLGADEQDRRRFHQEVEIVQELRHPGIVPVRDCGSEGPLEYLVMDLIEGRTLAHRLRGAEPMPWAEAVALMAQVARAVAAAHARGFVHRDLKPDNILLDAAGRPYVSAFGVARAVGLASSLTASGSAVGTPEYMSPEQSRGRHQDCGPASDVWSLGTMLYELVTGTSPFRGETALDSMALVNDHHPPSVRSAVPAVPPSLNRIVMQCLAKNPSRRYVDAAALAEDLERLARGERVSARSYSGLARWFRRLPRGVVPVTAMVLILGLGGATAWLGWSASRRGTWVQVAAWDFTDPHADLSGLRFSGWDLTGDEEPWPRVDDGLAMPRAEWLWLRDVDLPADVRLDVEVAWGGLPDGLELCINSRPAAMRDDRSMPVGYSCQVAGWGGLLDFVSRNETDEGRHTAGARHAPTEGGTVSRISFYRRDDRFVLAVDGRDTISERYPLPISGTDLGGVGLKTFANGARLRRLSVSRFVAGSLTTPLERADALVAAGALEAAAAEYLAIASVHREEVIAAPALARAYLAHHELDAESEQLATIEAELARRHPDSDYLRLVWEARLLDAWREGDIDPALRQFDDIVARFGASRALLRCLDIRRLELGPRQATRYLEAIARDRGLTALDLHGLGLRDLSPLAGLPLAWLDLHDNPVADLSPLAGMPLRYLDLQHTRVRDLGPLAASPLRDLVLMHTPVSTLAGLEGAQIRNLWAADSGLIDLEGLQGWGRLSAVALDRTAGRDLSPLRGLAIERFYAQGTAVSDLSPLAGAPLEEVYIGRTAVQDIAPVANPRLRHLGASELGLESVAVLGVARNLTSCYLSGNRLREVTSLSGLPLETVYLTGNAVEDLSPLAGTGSRIFRCHRNPVTTLDGLLHDPPSGMRVPPVEALGEEALARGLTAWAQDHPRLAMFCAGRLARLRGDADLARSHARSIAGRPQIILMEELTREAAHQQATAWGGHLSVPMDASDLEALASEVTEGDLLWTGLVVGEAGEVRHQGSVVPLAVADAEGVAAGTPLVIQEDVGLRPATAQERAWPVVTFPQ